MKKLIFLFIFFLACSQSPDPINNSPVIESLTASSEHIASDTISTLFCKAMDPDNDHLVYFWETSDGEIIPDSCYATWRPPQNSGLYNVICTVSDPWGGKDAQNIYLRVTKFDTINIEFTDMPEIPIDPGLISKGKYWFDSDSSWEGFLLDNGYPESELIPSPVDFNNYTLIAVFMSPSVGCGDYKLIIDQVTLYKDKLTIVDSIPNDYGSCFADIDPYQIIKVNQVNVKVQFEGFYP